jgi:hypothetical protein
MPLLNFSILPHLAVSMAIATSQVDGVIREIKVWMKTVNQLSDSVAFINDNDLKPEIFAKAGVADTDYFDGLGEVENSTSGQYYLYEMRLYHTETA